MLVVYEKENGKCPFLEWLNNLKDIKARATIRARIERVALGNLGDCKSLKHDIFEIRIHYGPGYRVYFGKDGLRLKVILYGGNKNSQKRDIEKANKLWKEYQNAS